MPLPLDLARKTPPDRKDPLMRSNSSHNSHQYRPPSHGMARFSAGVLVQSPLRLSCCSMLECEAAIPAELPVECDWQSRVSYLQAWAWNVNVETEKRQAFNELLHSALRQSFTWQKTGLVRGVSLLRAAMQVKLSVCSVTDELAHFCIGVQHWMQSNTGRSVVYAMVLRGMI